MAANLFGLTGVSFGLVAETGGKIQDLEVRQTRESAVIQDEDGDECAVSLFNPKEEITFNFFPTGSTGIGGAATGAAVTLANYTPGAGIILVDEVTTTRPNTNYKKVAVKATVRPLVTS